MASYGENLRRQRELRGISLREIAEGTKISARFLQALEEDRVDVLPGGLFPRAFVRQYAHFLGLDVEKTVAEYVEAHGQAPPERRTAPPTPPRRFPLTAGQIFLAVVAILAVGLTLRRGSESRGPRAEPTPTAVVAAPAVLPTDRVYPAPTAEPASPVGDNLVLTMTARQDCWVEVRADGETVVNRILAEGESQTLEARGEIVLSVGNAGGLSISVNDRPALPLGRSGEVRKNIVITRQNLPTLVQPDGGSEPDGQSG